MIVHRLAQFNGNEAREIESALAGIVPTENHDGPTWDVIRRFRNRVQARELFTYEQLWTVRELIDVLVRELEPQTTIEYWQAVGATGSTEAIWGLAREREMQIGALLDMQTGVIQYALVLTRPSPNGDDDKEGT